MIFNGCYVETIKLCISQVILLIKMMKAEHKSGYFSRSLYDALANFLLYSRCSALYRNDEENL